MKWEEELWAELDAMPQPQQIIAAGEIINRVSQTILPALGDRRRQVVIDLLEQGMDATTLAETIGARRGTITRLAQEGRAGRPSG